MKAKSMKALGFVNGFMILVSENDNNSDRVHSSSISEDYHSTDSQSSMQAISESHEVQVFEHVEHAMPPVQDNAGSLYLEGPLATKLDYIIEITTELV